MNKSGLVNQGRKIMNHKKITEEAVNYVESRFQVGVSTINAISVTGEPYVTFSIGFKESPGEIFCAADAESLLEHFKRSFDDYAKDKNGKLYWRRMPEIVDIEGGYAIRARLLISSEPPQAILNKSGINPVEYKILIEPEDVEKKTESGIILTEKVTDREKMAQVRGKLIAVGGNAFEDWNEPIPKVGDKISYAKYAGLIVKGHDEIEYRLVNDKDITAIVMEESND